MMYILGHLRKHFLQYHTLPSESLGSVKCFKEVSYAHQACIYLIKKQILNIIYYYISLVTKKSAHTLTHTRAVTRTHTLACARAHTHTHTLAHTHTRTHTHTHTHTHTRAVTRTHTHSRSHAHKHTHTNLKKHFFFILMQYL